MAVGPALVAFALVERRHMKPLEWARGTGIGVCDDVGEEMDVVVGADKAGSSSCDARHSTDETVEA
jgi:hypothetical protein